MLSELTQLLGHPSVCPTADLTGVQHDSRRVKAGDIYAAVRGAVHDGHDYINDAIQAGAAAILVDQAHATEFVATGHPGWVVQDTRQVMGLVADVIYKHPTQSMHVVGVTGTNGKTSTTHIIAHLAKGLFGQSGIIGTLGSFASGIAIPSERTTPEAPELQRIIAQMKDYSVEMVAMEVASHALVMGRVNGCLFDAAVFTNLTQDHLDFHGDMETYFLAKSQLFVHHLVRSREAGKHPFAVVNIGDEWGRRLATNLPDTTVTTYATDNQHEADLCGKNICLSASLTEFDVVYHGNRHRVSLPLGGAFQVDNALAALAWFVSAGGGIELGVDLLSTTPQIPGRFETVTGKQRFTVVVDYAHTPDGLENVLKTARGLCRERLISVFGCGGDRDRSKRPLMGQIASRYSDAIVVTSDNPRSENPNSIIDDIVAGISISANVHRISDRRSAISASFRIAQSGDVVVIAGKGHETYQIIGDQVIDFDDRMVAAEELEQCF